MPEKVIDVEIRMIGYWVSGSLMKYETEENVNWSEWNVAHGIEKKGQKPMCQWSLRCDMKKIYSYEQLYLDKIAGCSSDELVVQHLMRKLGGIDMSYCDFEDEVNRALTHVTVMRDEYT